MSEINVIIELWVCHSEGKKVLWKAENWQGAAQAAVGAYDPLVLSREGGPDPDCYQMFKLNEIALVDGQRTAIYYRIPVSRAGWFYKALPKWGFKKMAEAAFIKLPLESEAK